jgi:hypothetical protein
MVGFRFAATHPTLAAPDGFAAGELHRYVLRNNEPLVGIMRSIDDIKIKFPTLYDILGLPYIEELKNEQGALANRATINPFFSILYNSTDKELSDYIEKCFTQAVDKKAISLERLKRFRDEKQHVNIQNFINEITMLQPLY